MVGIGGVSVGLEGSGAGSGAPGAPGAPGGGRFRTKDPWEAAVIVAKWYEENAERIKNLQKLYETKKSIDEEKEELKKQNNETELLLSAANLMFPEKEWLKIRKKEFKASEVMQKLIRQDLRAAKFLYEILRKIEQEHGFRALPTMIYESAAIRGSVFEHTCRTVNRARSRRWQYPCYRVCEQYRVVRENGKKVVKKRVPVTILRHIDRETGEIINEEYRWGHQWINVPPDDMVYTEVIRDFKEITVKGKEAEIAARLGYYCPVFAEIAGDKSILIPEKEPWIPEKSADHFPEDIVAVTSENGEIRKIWLSRKHGSRDYEGSEDSDYEDYEEYEGAEEYEEDNENTENEEVIEE